MHKPFLIGEKIYLREIEKSDLNENYQQWLNDAEVCKFNSHHKFPYYREEMEEYYKNFIKSKNNLVLAIIDKKTDKHIGNIALHNISSINLSADLTIIIGDKNYWSKGVGVDAAGILIEHGFNSLNLHRIYCGTSDENKGMQKLAEKLGFKKEGTSREAFYNNGQYRDIIYYGLLKDEYKK